MEYFQTDVLHFFICGEREEHQSFNLILSDHKLICFQPQNVNNLFSAVFIGPLSAKSCFSRNQHSLQELLHLTVFKRITQIQNVKSNISVGACLAALWLGKRSHVWTLGWLYCFSSALLQVFHYRSGLYQQNILLPKRCSNFKTIK